MNKLEFIKRIEDNVSDEVKEYLKANKVSIDCVEISDKCTALVFERTEWIPADASYLYKSVSAVNNGGVVLEVDGINYDSPDYYDDFFKYLEKLNMDDLCLGKEVYYKPYYNNFMYVSHGLCYFYSRKCYHFIHSKICESYADFVAEKLHIKKKEY